MISIGFSVAYYVTTLIHLVFGALGICFPFGILGIYIPSYSLDELGQDETELMTLHLARMCQVTAFFTGLSLLLLRNQSSFVRAVLVATTNAAAVLYSLGEILIDAPRAQRLGIDTAIKPAEDFSRSIQFLIGCLDGGSIGTMVLSGLCFLIAVVALLRSDDNSRVGSKRE